jgi:hypothetical protein
MRLTPKTSFNHRVARSDKGKPRLKGKSTPVGRAAATAAARAARAAVRLEGSAGSSNEEWQDADDSFFPDEEPMVVLGNPELAKQHRRGERMRRVEREDGTWDVVQPQLLLGYIRVLPSSVRWVEEELKHAKEAFALKVRIN